MDFNAHVRKLRITEIRSRGISAIASAMIALFFVILILRDYIGSDRRVWAAVGIMYILWTWRIFLFRRTDVSERQWYFQNYWQSVVIGAGWGYFFHHIIVSHPEVPSVREIAYLTGIGTLLAGGYSLAISAPMFYLFEVPIYAGLVIGFYQVTPEFSIRLGGLINFIVFFLMMAIQRKVMVKRWMEGVSHNFQLQSLIDSIPGGIVVAQGESSLRANTYFEKQLGIQGTRAIMDRLLGVPSFREHYRSFLSQEGLSTLDFEAVLATSNGPRVYWFVLVRPPVDVETQEHGQIVIVGMDIQARKDAESIIEKQRHQLESSARMAALGEMAGGVAHEINNPLFVISSRAQLLSTLLSKSDLEASKFRSHLDVILNTSDRIGRIVRGLKSFARGSEGEPMERTDMGTIVEQTLELCDSRLKGTRVKLQIDPLPEDGQLVANPIQISQILLNLLNNAVDAVEGSSDPWIQISVKATPDLMEISVTDSGLGIPHEIRDKIMQPFFTTKPVGKGTGLGLSISLGIVKSHGGELYYDESSFHTKFVVRLPRHPRAEAALNGPLASSEQTRNHEADLEVGEARSQATRGYPEKG